jgi:hypothetical protein
MGEDEGNRLASLDRELPDGFEVFAAKRNRGPQDHPLWAASALIAPSSSRLTHGTVAP